LTIIIVVGGVMFGIMTATESAAVAAVYSFILAFFIYKEAKWSDIGKIFLSAVKTTGNILFLATAATAFSWILTYLQIPQAISHSLLALTSNKFLIFLIVNIIFII